jgi:flagellar biosynthesis/type III secretory pathway M-ring protein FliF/YscJ
MTTIATIIGALWLAIFLIVVVLLVVVLLVERTANLLHGRPSDDPQAGYDRSWSQVEAELSRAAYRETMAAKTKLRIIAGGKE